MSSPGKVGGAVANSTQEQEMTMKAARFIALSVMGATLQVAGASQADELPRPSEPAPQYGRSQDMSKEEQKTAYREQLQEHIRNMTPTEQALMRDTSVNGHARLESGQSENRQGMQRRGRGAGGYGQGYESRRRGGSPGGWQR